MQTTLTLDEAHFKTACEKARARGESAEQYVQWLIDTHVATSDEILEPIRRGFEGIPDDELDALLARAQVAARKQP
jgi:hypothetical protein